MKEKALMSVVGVIVLFAIAVGTWFLSAEAAWKKAAKQYAKACETYEKESRLIAQRNKWNEAYETSKASMPSYEVGQATDTICLRKIDAIAATNFVNLATNAGKESEVGDVLELPIDGKELRASLESLVKFMHELENTEQGMFDIKEISLQPMKDQPGCVKGSVVVTCAYMRGE